MSNLARIKPEAFSFVSKALGSGVNSFNETTSALWLLRNNQRAKNSSKQPMQISGGNSRLPEKMAAALKSPVQTNKVVESIQSSDTGVEVHCSDGSRFQADYMESALESAERVTSEVLARIE